MSSKPISKLPKQKTSTIYQHFSQSKNIKQFCFESQPDEDSINKPTFPKKQVKAPKKTKKQSKAASNKMSKRKKEKESHIKSVKIVEEKVTKVIKEEPVSKEQEESKTIRE